jgi:hypothetical protein
MVAKTAELIKNPSEQYDIYLQYCFLRRKTLELEIKNIFSIDHNGLTADRHESNQINRGIIFPAQPM